MDKKANSPKILLFDIETTPLLGYTWGFYDQNVLKVEQDPYILCFAHKWLDDKKTHVTALDDFALYKRSKRNDKHVVKKLHKLLDEANIVIGQNSNRFDLKWANKQFIKHGLSPVSYYQKIDTLKVAKKHFRFDSNRLDELGRFLGVGRKVVHEGKDLWFSVMDGDKDAWNRMKTYVEQDVMLLEKVYYKLRPYMENHPNLNAYNEDPEVLRCPTCQSTDVQKRGFAMRGRFSKAQRYQCNVCGKWGQGSTKRIPDLAIS